MRRRPISLERRGVTLAFYFVPAGSEGEQDGEHRVTFFLPCQETGADLEEVVAGVIGWLHRAFEYGVRLWASDEMHVYDLTQSQMMSWLFTVTATVDMVSRTGSPVPMCMCTPEEANGLHGGLGGVELRVYSTEGDVPVRWRIYRLIGETGDRVQLKLLDTLRHVSPPQPRMAKATTRKRTKQVADHPTATDPLTTPFSDEEQLRLEALRKVYNPEKMARDGAAEDVTE